MTRYPTSTVAQQDIRIGELEVDLATAQERIEAALALHRAGPGGCCVECWVHLHPCPTVKALRGES